MQICCNCKRNYDETKNVVACKISGEDLIQFKDSQTGKIISFCPDCVRAVAWGIAMSSNGAIKITNGIRIDYKKGG